ncbi:hypothetical protein Plhal304r1_c014g0051761 [Plasmopara halstedii]
MPYHGECRHYAIVQSSEVPWYMLLHLLNDNALRVYYETFARTLSILYCTYKSTASYFTRF